MDHLCIHSSSGLPFLLFLFSILSFPFGYFLLKLLVVFSSPPPLLPEVPPSLDFQNNVSSVFIGRSSGRLFRSAFLSSPSIKLKWLRHLNYILFSSVSCLHSVSFSLVVLHILLLIISVGASSTKLSSLYSLSFWRAFFVLFSSVDVSTYYCHLRMASAHLPYLPFQFYI